MAFDSSFLNTIRIVLVHTSHAGNIGAVARAMKTMGVEKLVLVAPKAAYPSVEATARAAGADSILEKTQVVNTLEEAIADSHLVIGTSAQQRYWSLPILSPQECPEFIDETAHRQNTAIIFGTERSGLSNQQLALCQRQVVIPANEVYSSLNLAHAVQVICYELRKYQISRVSKDIRVTNFPLKELADQATLVQFYKHLEEALLNIKFLNPSVDKKIMPRLQRLFQRTCLEKEEVDLLRGILKAVERK